MIRRSLPALVVTTLCLFCAHAQTNEEPTRAQEASSVASKPDLLEPEDVVQVKVYQEDDLETRTVIDKDGIVILPLVGPAKVGERTPDEATALIRGLYAKDYLIDPQVSLVVIEHAKRHFTVMGQVQRPGTYEMPVTKPLNLLQAIATAGGYTRLAARSRITVQRMKKGQPVVLSLNADSMSKDNKSKPFEIQPDDIVTVRERMF